MFFRIVGLKVKYYPKEEPSIKFPVKVYQKNLGRTFPLASYHKKIDKPEQVVLELRFPHRNFRIEQFKKFVINLQSATHFPITTNSYENYALHCRAWQYLKCTRNDDLLAI